MSSREERRALWNVNQNNELFPGGYVLFQKGSSSSSYSSLPSHPLALVLPLFHNSERNKGLEMCHDKREAKATNHQQPMDPWLYVCSQAKRPRSVMSG